MQSATSFVPEKDNQCALSGWAEVVSVGMWKHGDMEAEAWGSESMKMWKHGMRRL